jgi:hypothetical protein
VIAEVDDEKETVCEIGEGSCAVAVAVSTRASGATRVIRLAWERTFSILHLTHLRSR